MIRLDEIWSQNISQKKNYSGNQKVSSETDKNAFDKNIFQHLIFIHFVIQAQENEKNS